MPKIEPANVPMPGTIKKKTAAEMPSVMKDQCKSDIDWMLSEFDADDMGDLGMREIGSLVIYPYVKQAWLLGYQAGLADAGKDSGSMRIHGEAGPLRIVNHKLIETTVKRK